MIVHSTLRSASWPLSPHLTALVLFLGEVIANIVQDCTSNFPSCNCLNAVVHTIQFRPGALGKQHIL